MLHQVRFDIGKSVDGNFGPETEAAVVSFQYQKRYTQNGIVDSKI